ncbi:MAG: 2OG-Fe(II) oxygenase family protein [Rhizonema sp. NSF051]|nr:2OG-Fe(II) oxygenase family protein [Rhizonema sp. NSF051]
MVLNWNALQNAVVHKSPYRWMQFENLLPEDASKELIQSFPKAELFLQRDDGWFCNPGFLKGEVIDPNSGWYSDVEKGMVGFPIQYLSEVWQKLISQELWSPAYREIMEELSGLNLENHRVIVSFERRHSRPERAFIPHTDSKHKTFTHLLYLHEQWPVEWGGSFRVLSSEQPESVVYENPPVIHSSVAIVQSDNSWHMVTPISPMAAYHIKSG